MAISLAILLILCGLGIMGFGLLMFYAWLPLFYGLFGFELGLLLGRWLTGDIGVAAVTLGIAIAALAGGLAYYLEHYRRALVGFTGGVVLVLAALTLLGLERVMSGFTGIVLALIGGAFGATVALRYFDLFIVASSSFGGAALIITGARLLLPTVEQFSGFLPTLLTVILGVFGLRWQMSNLATWAPPTTNSTDSLTGSAGKHADLRNP
jgi:hypothetical protein